MRYAAAFLVGGDDQHRLPGRAAEGLEPGNLSADLILAAMPDIAPVQHDAADKAAPGERLDLSGIGIPDDEMPAEQGDVLVTGRSHRQPVQGMVRENAQYGDRHGKPQRDREQRPSRRPPRADQAEGPGDENGGRRPRPQAIEERVHPVRAANQKDRRRNQGKVAATGGGPHASAVWAAATHFTRWVSAITSDRTRNRPSEPTNSE